MVAWTPANQSGAEAPSAWWDPASGFTTTGGALSSWASRVGTAVAAQSTVSKQPTVAAYNGVNVPTFDGSDDVLTITDANKDLPDIPTACTIFVVTEAATGISDGSSPISWGALANGARRAPAIGGGDYNKNGAGSYGANTAGVQSWQGYFSGDAGSTTAIGSALAVLQWDQAAGTGNVALNMYKSNTALTLRSATYDAEAATRTGAYMGACYNSTLGPYWKGRILEIVVYKYIMTADQRSRTSGYLHWRWGLQANLPANDPYANAAPQVDNGSAGTAAGVATVQGIGAATARGQGAASGVGAAQGAAGVRVTSTGGSAGAGYASGVGGALATAQGNAAGTAAASASGSISALASGTSAGSGTGAAIGVSRATGLGSAIGTATASGAGQQGITSTGTAAGSSSAIGVAAGASVITATGAAAGQATAAAAGSLRASAAGSASGQAGGAGIGSAGVVAIGVASGKATAQATSSGVVASIGSAAASSVAVGAGRAVALGVGHSDSASNCTAPGSARVQAIGVASGLSGASAISRPVSTAPVPASRAATSYRRSRVVSSPDPDRSASSVIPSRVAA